MYASFRALQRDSVGECNRKTIVQVTRCDALTGGEKKKEKKKEKEKTNS